MCDKCYRDFEEHRCKCLLQALIDMISGMRDRGAPAVPSSRAPPLNSKMTRTHYGTQASAAPKSSFPARTSSQNASKSRKTVRMDLPYDLIDEYQDDENALAGDHLNDTEVDET